MRGGPLLLCHTSDPTVVLKNAADGKERSPQEISPCYPTPLWCCSERGPRPHYYPHFPEDWGNVIQACALGEPGTGSQKGVLVVALLRRDSHATQFTHLQRTTQGLGCSSACKSVGLGVVTRLRDHRCNQSVYARISGTRHQTQCLTRAGQALTTEPPLQPEERSPW